ncbi:MAG: GNAT family N-acetyltransferase [Actinomycetota bacterium]
MQIDIRPMPLPAHPDDAGPVGDEFRAAFAINERSNAERYGEGLYVNTPVEFLASLQSNADYRLDRFHAWDGDRIVGVITLYSNLLDSTGVVEAQPELSSDLGAAEQHELAELLVARAHEEAARAGRSTVIMSTVGAATGPVTARSGFGGADPAHPEAAPLVARGYALEQVYRVSVASLADLPDLDDRLAAAEALSPGYEMVRWTGDVPAEHREAMRGLYERMSTDAPVGGLAWEPEVWDEARLAEFERTVQDGGRVLLTVAARELATGELGGFSTLILPRSGATARQHDTLVAKPHRGHGLGMRMKLDNLVRLREVRPELVRIVTWNAEENRPMLSVNEASGFLPVAYEAQWQWKESR